MTKCKHTLSAKVCRYCSGHDELRARVAELESIAKRQCACLWGDEPSLKPDVECATHAALRRRHEETEAELMKAREIVKRFVVAQGPHLYESWREALIKDCGLIEDAIGFVTVPSTPSVGTPTEREILRSALAQIHDHLDETGDPDYTDKETIMKIARDALGDELAPLVDRPRPSEAPTVVQDDFVVGDRVRLLPEPHSPEPSVDGRIGLVTDVHDRGPKIPALYCVFGIEGNAYIGRVTADRLERCNAPRSNEAEPITESVLIEKSIGCWTVVSEDGRVRVQCETEALAHRVADALLPSPTGRVEP